MTTPAHVTLAAVLSFAAVASGLPMRLHAQPGQSELVVVQEGAAAAERQYHRSGCPVVRDGKGVAAMTRGEAESRGYKPHRECDPATSAASGGKASGRQDGAGPAAEEFVFIDAAENYYHRQGCKHIGKTPRKVLLRDVGKRWPCPTCRPPIRKPADAPLVPRWRG